jgi:opacity protein-like surface antigen
MAGLDFQSTKLDDSKGDSYDHTITTQGLMAAGLYYLGYKRNIFLVPYLKAGIGGAIVSEQIKDSYTDTKKENQFAAAAEAGAGLEWFVLKFFSLKLEASYNVIAGNTGLISYPTAAITGNLYFDAPFYVNDRGIGGPY